MIDLGQVFTKNSVAKYMVSLFNLPKQSAILEMYLQEMIKSLAAAA